MNGPVALHGGGEFLPGDEPSLRALLELAPRVSGVVRVAVVPTAAARGRPALAAANGVNAFRRVAADLDIPILAEAVPVVDAASAADPSLADRLAAATLIYLPGGDPDLVPKLYPGSAAWIAMQGAWSDGAVLAGASAGAMALAAWTWTPAGGVEGLGIVPGISVAPHADAASWDQALARYGAAVRADLGLIGVAERTAVVVSGTAGEPWRVVGQGEARWLSPIARANAAPPVIAHDGETIEP